MTRFAVGIEYCGLHYSGWQFQKHAPSVQQAVEMAVSKVANHPVTVIAAGRTDTGVHASGQIGHFDSVAQRTLHQWLRGINTYLPDDVSITFIQPVSDQFHARFAARCRSYRYVLLNRPVSPSILYGRVSWHPQPLDEAPMNRAAQDLKGRHDFSAYRAAGCQNKNPVKEIYSVSLQRCGQWLWLDIAADGFLQHMVRNIIGTLIPVGQGLKPTYWPKQVLESLDRKQGGITAPPDGLYLAGIRYDAEFDLPDPPESCRFW